MRLLFVLIFFISFSLANAQEHKIKINVRDSLTNKSLPFANIYLKNTGIGASTNLGGIAFLNKQKALNIDTIVISYVGYESKHVVFNKNNENEIQIALNPSSQVIDEVVFTYKKPLNPDQILRKAIKNTSSNYSNKNVILNCVFRETIQENNEYIQLNEAFTNIHYTSYPQKKLDPDIWKDWYYDETYAFNLEANLYFTPLLKDFNTKDDKMQIIASRSSENWSEYGIETVLLGGPLLLTAFDKLKYQYDFLNPKIINKYVFIKGELEYVNGTTCYTLNFYPKETNNKFVIDQSRKNKDAIYTGKLYIEKETFAVVKFEYQLAVNRDYGFFADRMPLDYAIEVNYSKNHDFWYLNSIKQVETRKVGVNQNNNAILHTGTKELFVLNVEKESVVPFPDSTIFKSTRLSSIRFYDKNYNPNYWQNYDLPEECKLNDKIKTDLEKEESLEKQFQNRLILQENFNEPEITSKYYAFNYHGLNIVDSLHWMSLPEYEDEFKTYLSQENTFSKNYLLPDRSYQRKLFSELNNFYTKETELNKNIKIGSFYYDSDSLDNDILYQQTDSINRTPIFNLTKFLSEKKNTYITRVIPNKKQNLILIQYEKLGSIGNFVSVFQFGKNQEIDSLSNIYAVEWLTDSTMIYAQTNVLGRSNKLFHHNIGSTNDTLLYSESDETFDVDINKQKEYLFCTVQSKSENEIYWIEIDKDIPKLKLIQKREKDILYQIKVSDKWYMLTNKGATNNQILESKTAFPFQWKQVLTGDSKNYIKEFIISKNYIITDVYENSYPKIKYIKKEQNKWNDSHFELGIGNINLGSCLNNTDTIVFSYSSASQPYTKYKYGLTSGNLIKDFSDSVKAPYSLKFISSKRLWAKSKDGTKIPITLIKSHNPIKTHKGLILKVYGAYGAYTIPSFSAQDAILLKYGYTIAYAHVRGDLILGNDWYKTGKLMNKKNSLDDYIACAKYLIKKKITTPDYLVAYGNSAGGLIVGWAINEYPGLFNTAILDHPYLDVLNTMMNDTLPLTKDEYKEWGNPNDLSVFNYIKSYSPYQNIKEQSYPNLIYIASYYDYQTPIWQVAKHVGAIRQMKSKDNNVILLTDMNSGHIGNTTGKEWIKLYSQIYSFVNINLFKGPIPRK